MTRTVGVEEEFLLVRATGGEPAPRGDEVARAASRRSGVQFEHELKREQAELGSLPCRSVEDLRQDLRERRRQLAAGADTYGVRLAALGTSPFPGRPTPTADRRYARIGEAFGQVAAPQLTCGMHVHVSVGSPDEGVGVLDRIGPWLPPLLALTANSPFWQGEDTGYASYRSVVWGQWPTAGPTEPFGSRIGYERVRDDLVTSGAALDDGMLYFNARLSSKYPTVEIRIADVTPYADDAATVAALARALVETAAREWAGGRPPLTVRTELLRAACWRAARWGMAGQLLDLDARTPAPAWSVVQALVALAAPALWEAGDLDRVQHGLDAIRQRGNGADLQRRTHQRTGSFDAVVDAVVEQTGR